MVVACLGGLRTERWEESTLCTSARDDAWADASASLRAVELRGEAPISTRFVTKVGLIVSSRGGTRRAVKAGTVWVDRRRRSRGGMESMTRDVCHVPRSKEKRKKRGLIRTLPMMKISIASLQAHRR